MYAAVQKNVRNFILRTNVANAPGVPKLNRYGIFVERAYWPTGCANNFLKLSLPWRSVCPNQIALRISLSGTSMEHVGQSNFNVLRLISTSGGIAIQLTVTHKFSISGLSETIGAKSKRRSSKRLLLPRAKYCFSIPF